MAKARTSRREDAPARDEANLVQLDNPDDTLLDAHASGDPESLVGMDSPDDADQHPPYEGGKPPRRTGQAAGVRERVPPRPR